MLWYKYVHCWRHTNSQMLKHSCFITKGRERVHLIADMRAKCIYSPALDCDLRIWWLTPSTESWGIPHKTAGPKVFTNTSSLVQTAYCMCVVASHCQKQYRDLWGSIVLQQFLKSRLHHAQSFFVSRQCMVNYLNIILQ